MKKAICTKSVLPFLLLILVMAIGFSCVDMPSNGPELPDLLSEFRFVNAAPDLATVTVAVDDNAVGSIDYMGSTSYGTYLSGSRVITLSSDDTLRIAMPTSKRGDVIILSRTQANVPRPFIRILGRDTFLPTDSDTGSVRFVNAAVAPADIEIDILAAGTSVVENMIAVGANETSDNVVLPFGDYTINIYAAGDTTALATSPLTLSSVHKTSIVMGNDAQSLSIINLSDE